MFAAVNRHVVLRDWLKYHFQRNVAGGHYKAHHVTYFTRGNFDSLSVVADKRVGNKFVALVRRQRNCKRSVNDSALGHDVACSAFGAYDLNLGQRAVCRFDKRFGEVVTDLQHVGNVVVMVVGAWQRYEIVVDGDYVGVVFGNGVHLRAHYINVGSTAYDVLVLGRNFCHDSQQFGQVLSADFRQVLAHVGNHCGQQFRITLGIVCALAFAFALHPCKTLYYGVVTVVLVGFKSLAHRRQEVGVAQTCKGRASFAVLSHKRRTHPVAVLAAHIGRKLVVDCRTACGVLDYAVVGVCNAVVGKVLSHAQFRSERFVFCFARFALRIGTFAQFDTAKRNVCRQGGILVAFHVAVVLHVVETVAITLILGYFRLFAFRVYRSVTYAVTLPGNEIHVDVFELRLFGKRLGQIYRANDGGAYKHRYGKHCKKLFHNNLLDSEK